MATSNDSLFCIYLIITRILSARNFRKCPNSITFSPSPLAVDQDSILKFPFIIIWYCKLLFHNQARHCWWRIAGVQKLIPLVSLYSRPLYYFLQTIRNSRINILWTNWVWSNWFVGLYLPRVNYVNFSSSFFLFHLGPDSLAKSMFLQFLLSEDMISWF